MSVQATAQAAAWPRPGSAPGPGYSVARLTLTDFRNYRHLRLDLRAGAIVFTGENGAGKTNVLEAVSFLSPGRGLRRARLAEVGRGGAAWAVAATVDGPDGVIEVGTGIEAEPGAPDRRVVRIDGKTVRGTASLAAKCGIGWLTPQMDRLFLDGASARRRFLDRLAYGYDSAHAGRVSAYEKALRERGRLLRDGSGTPAWLAALEETMAGYSVAIAAARRDVVARLSGAMDDGIDPFPRATLSVEGDVESWLDSMPAVEAEQRLRASWLDSRATDAASGGAATGPHRSDLAVCHVGNGMPAALCSTGEQKALLVAIVLADSRLREARLGRAPVLLLDEVATHLDAPRREALFSALSARRGQTWMTGTDASVFDPLAAAQHLRVEDGRVYGDTQ